MDNLKEIRRILEEALQHANGPSNLMSFILRNNACSEILLEQATMSFERGSVLHQPKRPFVHIAS